MKTRRTKLPAALFALAVLMSVANHAKDNAREASLRAAELARFDASVRADSAALERLLDADLAYTHSDGELETRAQFIANLANGRRDYVAIDSTVEKLRVIGDVGLIRGRARVTVAGGSQPVSFTISYDEAWLWKEGRWQMTAWRSTRLPEPAPAARNEAGARNAVLSRFDAALAGNVAALDPLLADDLDYCTLRGECETKQQYLDEIRTGRLKYRSINPTVDKVKLAGDQATVIGHVAVTAERDGVERSANILFTALLAWRQGRWQHTTWSSTIIEPQGK